jgi:colicin import membrane protein
VRERRYTPAFIFSILLHISVLLILIVSVEFESKMSVLENVDNNSKIISAVAMNLPVTQAEPAPPPPPPIHHEEPKKMAAEPPKPKPMPQPSKQQVDDLQKQLELQTQDAIALKKEEHKKQLAQQKSVIEKQLLADLQKQKKKVDKNKMKQKALEQAMEKELKDQAAKSLEQQFLHEQKRAAGAKSLGVVNKYKALIQQAISDRWLVPSGVDKKLSSELLIRLAPGGLVLDVQITRSSGDVSLDRSARDAVFKASPLPVPADSDEFNQFRQFVLKVKPQNIITNNA